MNFFLTESTTKCRGDTAVGHQNAACEENQAFASRMTLPGDSVQLRRLHPTKIGLMVTFAFAVVAYVRAFFVSRHKLALEAVALRQQLAVFMIVMLRSVPNCAGSIGCSGLRSGICALAGPRP